MIPQPLKLELAEAQKIGAAIVAALAPFCEKIEIAGSVRRERPVCGDIDIVCLPIPGQITALQNRLSKNTRIVSGTGEEGKNLIRLLNVPRLGGDVQIDLFIAQHPREGLFDTEPSNWGSILLCRTGSPSHNIRICALAKDQGLSWQPYRGLLTADGRVLAAAEEADIYQALGLDYLAPADRQTPGF